MRVRLRARTADGCTRGWLSYFTGSSSAPFTIVHAGTIVLDIDPWAVPDDGNGRVDPLTLLNAFNTWAAANAPPRDVAVLDVLADTRTAFFGLRLDAGQQELTAMMEQDREQLCGPRPIVRTIVGS